MTTGIAAVTEVDPQMVLDLLNAADADEWKDPSIREMFRLVAQGFRQVLVERDRARSTATALRHYLTLAQPYVNPKHDFSRRVEKILEETAWIDR